MTLMVMLLRHWLLLWTTILFSACFRFSNKIIIWKSKKKFQKPLLQTVSRIWVYILYPKSRDDFLYVLTFYLMSMHLVLAFKKIFYWISKLNFRSVSLSGGLAAEHIGSQKIVGRSYFKWCEKNGFFLHLNVSKVYSKLQYYSFEK